MFLCYFSVYGCMLCLVCYLFVISTSVIDCLGRLVPEMTYYVSSGTLNLTKLKLWPRKNRLHFDSHPLLYHENVFTNWHLQIDHVTVSAPWFVFFLTIYGALANAMNNNNNNNHTNNNENLKTDNFISTTAMYLFTIGAVMPLPACCWSRDWCTINNSALHIAVLWDVPFFNRGRGLCSLGALM